MKKVFVPSMDELYEMQDMGANIYKYLLVKTIETLAVYGVNYPNKGMLKNAYKYLREDPYIASAICMMYPEELKYSEIASSDVNLCLKLLEQPKDTRCSLDYLSKFDSSVLINNSVLESVIHKLHEELKSNPKYRFEYQDNELIKKILDRELSDDDLMGLRYVVSDLFDIEPAYGISLGSHFFENNKYDRPSRLSTAVNNYASTYGIPSYVGAEYLGKDILTNPNCEVKRLIKCINKK